MKILITGGAGFIGSNVVDGYLAKGHEVAILDNLSTGLKENINSKAKFYNEDIKNRKDIDKIFGEFKPDIVNHHAAQMDVRISLRDPIFDAETNIIGSLNIITASVQHGVKKIIYISTGGAVHGYPKNLPVREDDELHPACEYGISKHTPEHYLELYGKIRNQINYVIFRYPNVYGPRQNTKGEAGVNAIFIEKMLKNEDIVLYGYGDAQRDYVFISDIVRANILALETGINVIINLGSGKGTSVLEIFNILAKKLNYVKKPLFEPLRPGEIDNTYLNSFRAYNILDWKSQINLETGLEKTIEYWKNKLNV